MSEESGLSSAFPPPPKEFELFTDANLEAYKQDSTSVSDVVAHAMKSPDLPTKAYSVFGETWQVSRLYPVSLLLADVEDRGQTSVFARFRP